MTMYEQDWGFNAAGTPLGGESSLSMPGPRSIDTFGSPLRAAYDQRTAFTQHVKRRYENVSPVNAGLWDPRGESALSFQPADYYEGVEEVSATLKDFEVESDRVMNGGVPEFGDPMPNSNVNLRMLAAPATGLTRENADRLAASLSQYTPEIVESIAVPRDIGQQARFVNEFGIATHDGGIPDTWIEQDRRENYGPTLAEAAAVSVLSRQRPTEYVDVNGVPQGRYSPGTGPYDAPGKTRSGGIAGAIRGTTIMGDGAAARASGEARQMLSGIGSTEGASTSGGSKTGYIFGFVGLSLAAALGLGMLISGVQR